ncbi:MAG TPA: hypothetical protein DFR83_00670 [Deltaproteobacteria bacterium]|nr:hypothetical protein [Deltaproteobacteria bacterium]
MSKVRAVPFLERGRGGSRGDGLGGAMRGLQSSRLTGYPVHLPESFMSDADRPHRVLNIAPDHAGWRLDAYLSARFSSWSRTAVQKAIKRGEILVDGRRAKASLKLEALDVLRIYTKGYAPDGPPPPLPPVLYEDDRLLVINKPPGLLAHPAGDRFAYAVIGLMKEARPSCRVDLCHRLDRDTSGVMVLSKDLEANTHIKTQLRERSAHLQKTYLALVRGDVDWTERDVRAPIGDRQDTEIRLRRGVTDEGLPARTVFSALQKHSGHSLVQCALHTGRTHQIRVHLEHIGHPILGDKVYGQPDRVFLEWHEQGATPFVRARAGFPRQCLHAWKLRLQHPDGPALELEAPLPRDMQQVVDGALPVWPAPSSTPEAES